jgi:hypothetical protein
LVIYLALMVYLVVVKVVLELGSVEEILPAQATAFSWPVIGFLALAGGCAVWLGPRTGLPDLWDPTISPRKWLLISAVVGLGLGVVNLAFAAFREDHGRSRERPLDQRPVPRVNLVLLRWRDRR